MHTSLQLRVHLPLSYSLSHEFRGQFQRSWPSWTRPLLGENGSWSVIYRLDQGCSVHRKHAVLIIVDYLYYNKFKDFCKPGQENKNCYPDEHYIQTFLHIMDPSHLSNWTVTYVDWSEHLWHPKSFEEGDIAEDLFRTVKAIQNHEHVTSETYPVQTSKPCLWNGRSQGCFLFARKFRPETAEALVNLLPSKVWNNSIHHSRSSATPDDNNRWCLRQIRTSRLWKPLLLSALFSCISELVIFFIRNFGTSPLFIAGTLLKRELSARKRGGWAFIIVDLAGCNFRTWVTSRRQVLGKLADLLFTMYLPLGPT